MEPYKLSVDDKITVITGGYGHLGRHICESFAYHGAKVYVLGRDENKFKNAFENLAFKDSIFFINGDVSQNASLKNAFNKVIEREGRIDVLVNNAFYIKGQSPIEMHSEDFTYGLEGSITSVYRCIKEILPLLENGSTIINVSSMYGMVAPHFDVYEESPQFLNPPHYGAAKAGVLQLTKYYAAYLGNRGIRVNAVTPGAFPSREVQNDKEFIKRLKDRTVLNRIGDPEDVAGAFVFLASDAAKYITGQNLVIDGGWTIR